MAAKIKAVLQFKQHTVKVYYDPEFAEYIVKFWKDGVYLSEADYFTSDADDAMGTAHAQLQAWDAARQNMSM